MRDYGVRLGGFFWSGRRWIYRLRVVRESELRIDGV